MRPQSTKPETATILGHKAQRYTLSSDEGETELWLSEDFGKYTGFGDGFEQLLGRGVVGAV